jgi:hypothetical protein
MTKTGSPASPGSTSHNDKRQRELTSYINADVTPFPSCCYPPGGTESVQVRSGFAHLAPAFGQILAR